MRLHEKHPALSEARTIHAHSRRPVTSESNLLKSVSANEKIGKGHGLIARGRLTGQPLFSLTLEERATCPSTCERWAECYGNNTAFAHRFAHGPALESKLREEIAAMAKIYRQGFAIRLHVLGDFYSVAYVEMWGELLAKYPMMTIYGYTARNIGTPIGDALRDLRALRPLQFWIRISKSEAFSEGETIYAAKEGTVGIVCPEQTGKTSSCLTCGLCWSIKSTIIFLDHDKKNKASKVPAMA